MIRDDGSVLEIVVSIKKMLLMRVFRISISLLTTR